jgi:hypothetical protein
VFGHIVGSGRHRPDEEKLAAISELVRPYTKREVRRVLAFFSYFRSYIPNASELTHILSNLTAKGKPNRVVWTDLEDNAFQQFRLPIVQTYAMLFVYDSVW